MPPIRVVCQNCGTSGMAPENLAGKRVRCRVCSKPISVPGGKSPSAGPRAIPAPKKWYRFVPVVGAPLWLVVGWYLAMFSPWLGASPALQFIPLGITASWLACNFYLAVRTLGRTGHMLSVLPLTLLQIGLFGLLFFQIACHLGTDHFLWDSYPRLWDWPGFLLAHTLRAADLFSLLEAYGVNLQNLHHHSTLTAWCLLAFHLMLGLFFLGLVVEFIEPFTSRQGRQFIGWWVTLFLIFLLTWTISVEFVRHWRRADMFLWWSDNLVRVLDFPKILEIFRVHILRFPRTDWEGILTLVCRLFMGLPLLFGLARLSMLVRFRRLGGWGVADDTVEDLIDISTRTPFRKDALKLQQARKEMPTPEPLGWAEVRWQDPAIWGTAVVGLVIFLLGGLVGRYWEGPVERQAATASQPQEETFTQAVARLRRLGPYAAGAVPILAEALPRLQGEQQETVLETLAHLGIPGREQLGLLLLGPDRNLAMGAVTALRTLGPQAAPILAQGAFALYYPVRQAAGKALEELGPAAVPPLLDRLSGDTIWVYYPWLEKLDPDWNLRLSRNVHFVHLCRVKELASILADQDSGGLALYQVAGELLKIGRPVVVPALPEVQERLKKGPPPENIALTTEGQVNGFQSLNQAAQQLGAMPSPSILVLRNALEKLTQPPWPPEVLQQIDAADAGSLGKVLKGSEGKTALPALEKMLGDEDLAIPVLSLDLLRGCGFWDPRDVAPLVPLLKKPLPSLRKNAVQVLGRMGKAAVPAIPALTDVLKDEAPEVRLAAIQALGQIGPPAKEAIPALKKFLEDKDMQIRQEAAKALASISPR